MNFMIKYSIIIPVYNSEKTILRALNSLVYKESYFYEIIIVNDGSFDNSKMIIENFINTHSELNVHLINQENVGVSIARNNGINAASGEYIIFLDSDDYFDNRLFDFLRKYNDKLYVDLILFGYKYENNDRIWRLEDKDYGIEELLSNKIYIEILNTPIGKIFSRDIIKKHKIIFDKDLCYGEDSLFSYTFLSYTDSIAGTNDIFYLIDSSNMSSLSRKAQNNTFESMNKNIRQLFKLNIENLAKIMYFSRWLRTVIINEIKLNKNKKELYVELNKIRNLFRNYNLSVGLFSMDSLLLKLLDLKFYSIIILIIKLRLKLT